MTDVYRDHGAATQEELRALRRERSVVDERIAALERAIGVRRRAVRRVVAWALAVGAPATVLLGCCWVLVDGAFVCRIPKHEAAWRGAQRVQQAGELWFHTSCCTGCPPCPRVEDLVRGKKLDPANAMDPWGRPYRLACEDDSDTWAYSLGRDGVAHTADDIASDTPRASLDALGRSSE